MWWNSTTWLWWTWLQLRKLLTVHCECYISDESLLCVYLFSRHPPGDRRLDISSAALWQNILCSVLSDYDYVVGYTRTWVCWLNVLRKCAPTAVQLYRFVYKFHYHSHYLSQHTNNSRHILLDWQRHFDRHFHIDKCRAIRQSYQHQLQYQNSEVNV